MRKLAFISLAALLAASVAQATPITISNAGFEDNVTRNQVTNYNLLDGEFNDVSAVTNAPNPDAVPGWDFVLKAGIPHGGVGNVTTGWFADEAPEGENAAYSAGAWIIQDLTDTFQANTKYTLTVQIGQAVGGTGNAYTFGIAAPEGPFLGSINSNITTAAFTKYTVVYTTGSSGGPIDEKIRLLFGSNAQVWWDDVQLDAVPEPATIGMLGLGALLTGLLRRRL